MSFKDISYLQIWRPFSGGVEPFAQFLVDVTMVNLF